MKKIVLCVIISVFILQSCSNHSPAPVKDLSKSKSNTYKKSHNKTKRSNKQSVEVKKGDTLYSIGFANDIDYKQLAIFNNIKAPYRIYPGQRIKLINRNTVSTIKPIKKSNGSVVKTSPVKTNKFDLKVKVHKNPEPKKVVTTKPVVTNTPIAKVPATKSAVNSKPVQKKPIPKNSIAKTPIAKAPIKKAPVKIQPTPPAKAQWIWPVKGKILSSFSSSDTSRKGIKISSAYGKSVYASNSGTVVYSGDGLRGYGELIIVKHTNNLLSAYAHNSKRFVKEGQTVKQGQEIAKSGKGNDGRPLLHFEIRKNGQPVNPTKYLPK